MTKHVFSAQPYNIGDKIKGTVDSILDFIASKVQPEGHKTKGQQVGDTLSSGHGGAHLLYSAVPATSTHVPSSWHEQSTQYEGATRPQQGGPTAHLPPQAAYDYERERQGQPWTPPSLPHSSTGSFL